MHSIIMWVIFYLDVFYLFILHGERRSIVVLFSNPELHFVLSIAVFVKQTEVVAFDFLKKGKTY